MGVDGACYRIVQGIDDEVPYLSLGTRTEHTCETVRHTPYGGWFAKKGIVGS